jgi:hypothetical protein
MTTSWGIDPLKDGTGKVTLGTTAADFRQIQGGLYTPGVISGGVITRSASAHTYSVSAGVAAFPIVTGASPQTVLGPIPAYVLTIPPPGSGSTTYIIYARQRTVAVEGDPNVVVDFGTTLPDRAVMLNSFIVSSTTANSNAAVKTGDIKYSIPYGASLGILYQHTATANWAFTGRAADGTGSFFLPTDRLVRVTLTATLSAVRATSQIAAVGFDNAAYCEAGYDMFLDGVKKFSWTSIGLHQAWAEHTWTGILTIPQGTHTVKYERYQAKGPGWPFVRGNSSGGNMFILEDVGPVA